MNILTFYKNRSSSRIAGTSALEENMKNFLLRLIFSQLVLCSATAFGSFDIADHIPYSIKWSGPLTDATISENVVKLKLVTTNDERYECHIDEGEDDSHNTNQFDEYKGPTERELLDKLTVSEDCSVRIEPYWMYELCHGNKIRQYHEEKDPLSNTGTTVTHEYILGKLTEDSYPTGEEPEGVKMVIEGTEYPYYTVTYSDGTLCDLTEQTRLTRVHYICHSTARPILYEIKETATCEYSAIILINKICEHPKYKPKTETSRSINCHSLEGSPALPQGQVSFNHLMSRSIASAKPYAQLVQPTSQQSLTPGTRQKQPVIDSTESANKEIGEATDKDFLRQFLSGKQCIHGGSGWWSYEYCHLTSVNQYHLDKGKRAQEVSLGTWSENNHLNWITERPTKKPKPHPSRKLISLFYSGGNICDKTQKSREVEVRLKCTQGKDGVHGSSHAVAIYLVEPTICQYILTIESAVLCSVVEKADENGLIDPNTVLY